MLVISQCHNYSNIPFELKMLKEMKENYKNLNNYKNLRIKKSF